MDRPLEIAFHNMQPSPDLEGLIREQFAKLEKRHVHLIGARVSVEALHKQHQTGNPVEVHIILSLPGKDLAVSREPHHRGDRVAHPDARTTIRSAFDAAERQLDAQKRR